MPETEPGYPPIDAEDETTINERFSDLGPLTPEDMVLLARYDLSIREKEEVELNRPLDQKLLELVSNDPDLDYNARKKLITELWHNKPRKFNELDEKARRLILVENRMERRKAQSGTAEAGLLQRWRDSKDRLTSEEYQRYLVGVCVASFIVIRYLFS